MKLNYHKPSIHVVIVSSHSIICASQSTNSTTNSTNTSNMNDAVSNDNISPKPLKTPQKHNLNSEERLAQNVIDSHLNGDDSSFNHYSDILAKDAAMNHDLFYGCKSYYLLSQAFFYTLTRKFNSVGNHLQSYVFFFTHYYLLKARREMEKGNIPFDIKQYITLCKQLCYISTEYKELIFERITGLLPNASMDTFVYQIMGLAYVNFLSIQDKGANIYSDDYTEKYYKHFIDNNKTIINGTLSSNKKNAMYNHVHENEDTLLSTYLIEVIS